MRSLLLPLVLAVAASAHSQADPFDYHCADVILLQAKPVQTELKITEAQRGKMNDAAATHRTRLTTYEAQQKAARTKDTQQQTATKLKSYFDELKKGVFTALNGTQLKRLREITLQRAGLLALLDDVVAKKIGLAGANYQKFRTTFSDGAKQAGEIERTSLKPIFDKYEARMKAAKTSEDRKKVEDQMRPELEAEGKKIGPKIQALQNETQKKLLALLSQTQKNAWQALLGKPFNPQG